TSAGSNILRDFTPTYTATVAEKLEEAGSITLGKVNLDEFAMGSANLTSAFGAVENPWKRDNDLQTKLVPGGSSGGSAAAVAAGIAACATGTDTGGSIRQPASLCGIVGIKPTYGRCSRFGIIAFASSLDQAGILTRNVKDAAIVLQEMMGFDPKDSTSANKAVPDLIGDLQGTSLKGTTIGIPKQYHVDGMDHDVDVLWQDAARLCREAGAKIIDIDLPHTRYALPAYYIIAPAECSSNLARYDGVRYGVRAEDCDNLLALYEKTRAEGFGEEVKRRVLIGTYALSAGYYDAYYRKAQRVRRAIANDFKDAFRQCQFILTPTAPNAAFAMAEQMDPLQMYLNDVFTVPTSMAGLPAISLPGGRNGQGLPLGLQLIANSFEEAPLLAVAHALEGMIGFSYKPQYWAGS
ncbi:MAG: Asp-tRNA(Asn)/Glu-tRNA(Gln) amidotransferase subunit GatA, partial [Pseudomonadota bacterium]